MSNGNGSYLVASIKNVASLIFILCIYIVIIINKIIILPTYRPYI